MQLKMVSWKYKATRYVSIFREAFLKIFPILYPDCYRDLVLFTQIHTSVLIQLPEIRITKILDKADGFTCGFHFRPKFPAYPGKFIKTKHRFFDCKAIQVFFI